MEHLAHQGLNPHVQRVLKNFQTTAMRSLQGPGPGGFPSLLSPSDMAELEEYRKALVKKLPSDKSVDFESLRVPPPPFPIQQMPVFTPVDTPSKSEKIETLLEEERIACFLVGGEKRLCLPQILNTVLREFSLQQINAVCDELHIFCSRCNPEQLHILKVTGILPLNAPSCGLITKTDAERLCNALLHRTPEKFNEPPSPDSFKVYHECFGKCKGIFNPELYNNADAKCIQCVDCLGSFSTLKFVCHSHKALENRTCHWGFDSANWRSYLLLAKDQDGKDKLQDVLERMKIKFDSGNKYKRKQTSESETSDLKRAKSEDSASSSSSGSWADSVSGMRGLSAFRPWSPSMLIALKDGKLLPAAPAIMREGLSGIPPPYLHTGPPVLLHPERVIPLSESSRYERGFAPNVSLAPASQQKLDLDDVSEDEDTPIPDRKPTPEKATTVTCHNMEKSSSEYREWEVLSESEDSSQLSDEENRSTLSPKSAKVVEVELEMVQRALSGKVGSSQEEQEDFLKEFSNLQRKREEQLNRCIQSKKSLKQELSALKTSTREKLQRLADQNEKLEKDMEKMRIESECRLEEAQDDKERLLKEIKRLQGHDNIEAAKLLQMNREITTRLQQYEATYTQVRCENLLMQEELQRLGVLVPELLSKKKYNGHYTPSKGPSDGRYTPSKGSPDSSPTGVTSRHHNNQTMFIKKERDT
ncbi:ski oncogene-like [Ylistrum balloti]|uniref:ski oncogene-like n=1 Tax=Ylistrum balloti TaxID=509963 RepID=UPI002905A7DA|nr:ski oncogene-like [Ylistrum balloti]